MLSDEEKEILNNLKEYMQSEINKGYHKFIYNDLDWDFKCIDCINAIDKVLKQSKEIEEMKKQIDLDNECEIALNSKVMDLENADKKWEDKIKAKILECRKILYSFEKELELKANKEKYIHKESMNCLLSQISILQSLLEKE